MKRRGFLGLLGMAPAVPLIAKELATTAIAQKPVAIAEPAVSYQPDGLDGFEFSGYCGTAVAPLEYPACTMGYVAVSPYKLK